MSLMLLNSAVAGSGCPRSAFACRRSRLTRSSSSELGDFWLAKVPSCAATRMLHASQRHVFNQHRASLPLPVIPRTACYMPCPVIMPLFGFLLESPVNLFTMDGNNFANKDFLALLRPHPPPPPNTKEAANFSCENGNGVLLKGLFSLAGFENLCKLSRTWRRLPLFHTQTLRNDAFSKTSRFQNRTFLQATAQDQRLMVKKARPKVVECRP